MNNVTYQDAFVQGVRLLQQCSECDLCEEHQQAGAGEKGFAQQLKPVRNYQRDSPWVYRVLRQAFEAETGTRVQDGAIHLKPTDIAYSDLEERLDQLEVNYVEFTPAGVATIQYPVRDEK